MEFELGQYQEPARNQAHADFIENVTALKAHNPSVARHDVKGFMTYIYNKAFEWSVGIDPEYTIVDAVDKFTLMKEYRVGVDLGIPADEIIAQATTAEELINQFKPSEVHPSVRFAMNSDHHEWLYNLTHLWTEPRNYEVIERLRANKVNLPLLLDVIGLEREEMQDCYVSGLTAAMVLTAGLNAKKYTVKDEKKEEVFAPTVQLTTDEGGVTTITVANLSTIEHTGSGAYPRTRKIEIGERGSAAGSGVGGTGTGAAACEMLEPLCEATFDIYENGMDEGYFNYETHVQFPSHALTV